MAINKAETEYDAFNKTQKIVSDFDREVRKMLEEATWGERINRWMFSLADMPNINNKLSLARLGWIVIRISLKTA